MTKRRINKQQRSRIEKAQARHIIDEGNAAANVEEGLVIQRFGRYAEVELATEAVVRCAIRQNMGNLVAGDRVILNPLEKSILSCCDRKTVLSRVDKQGASKVIAANLSQIVIVIAPEPKPSPLLLDSYLVLATSLSINPLIVFNKMDLALGTMHKEMMQTYEKLGYSIVFSAKDNIHDLRLALAGKVSVFVGQSGVGKSTLIQQLLPDEKRIQIGGLSVQTGLGQHTTSSSRYYHLQDQPGGIIDSPGIRSLSLAALTPRDLIAGFPEFRELRLLCKFRDCNHSDTPGCAIVAFVRENAYVASRYASLLKMCDETLIKPSYFDN